MRHHNSRWGGGTHRWRKTNTRFTLQGLNKCTPPQPLVRHPKSEWKRDPWWGKLHRSASSDLELLQCDGDSVTIHADTCHGQRGCSVINGTSSLHWGANTSPRLLQGIRNAVSIHIHISDGHRESWCCQTHCTYAPNQSAAVAEHQGCHTGLLLRTAQAREQRN